ncbi:MAG TPA: class II aldolase/adducin family protein [Anaerolineales bacterium]|nr:class II aldolase/adducin family protein [Anaerolineales bacterium]
MSNFINAKSKIVESAQLLVKKGYLESTGGNLSIRIPGQEALAITPTNFDYMKMTADDICILDLQLNKLEGKLDPSVESGFHAGIYQVRPDVQAIIHTHQPFASALAIMKKPIPPMFDEQVRFLGRSVEIIPYAPSGTKMLINTIVRHVRNHHNAYILGNHGALCFGGSIENAINNVDILEKCSISYLLTLCSGEKAYTIPSIVREIAFNKLRTDQKRIERTVAVIIKE